MSGVEELMAAEKQLRDMLSRSASVEADTVPIVRRERDAIIMPASEAGLRGKLQSITHYTSYNVLHYIQLSHYSGTHIYPYIALLSLPVQVCIYFVV